MIYLAHAVGELYAEFAPPWVRRIFLSSVNLLLPEPLLRHTGPAAMETAVNDQPEENRRVIHLLYYVPERRANRLEIVEDTIPLYGVNVSLREDRPVESISLVPQGEPLKFDRSAGYLTAQIPVIHGHQMLAVDFAE